jgi:hypothetical protein
MSLQEMNGLILKSEGDNKMVREEKFIDQRVTYSIFKDGKFIIIENVPARVNPETGEQFFSPNTVDKIQKIILGHHLKPLKTISTPVFEFSE